MRPRRSPSRTACRRIASGYLPICQHVKNCSHKPCYSHSMSNSDVALREIGEIQDKHARDFIYFVGSFPARSYANSRALSPKDRKGSEQFAGCSPLGFSSIPGPERPEHQIVALIWEAEMNATWTYPLWLPVPSVSGVRYRSEGQNRNSGKSFLEENHRQWPN